MAKPVEYVIVSVRFNKEQAKVLEKVCKFYRTDGKLSQGIRRAVEDMAKTIEFNKLHYNEAISTITGDIRNEPTSNEGSSPTTNVGEPLPSE